MEPRKGGKVELFFRHKNIAPDETPPEKMKHVQDPGFKMPATILRWEPPHVLSYTFDEDSDVTFELTAQGKNVQLVLTHRARGEDLPSIAGYAGGWHMHLDHLIALLEGTPRPPLWPLHAKLKAEYEKILAAAPPSYPSKISGTGLNESLTAPVRLNQGYCLAHILRPPEFHSP